MSDTKLPAHPWSGRVVEINYETSRFLVRYEGIPPDVGTELADRERQAGEAVATVIKKGADRAWMSERLGSLPDGTYSLYLASLPAPQAVQAGWKLLKDTTHDERSWSEDSAHENGGYSCCCMECGRMFTGHKRRVVCKSCADAPTPKPNTAMRWLNVEAAMEDPVFQQARAIMGTNTWFQDNALRNAINYVLSAPSPDGKAEQAEAPVYMTPEDCMRIIRAHAPDDLRGMEAAFRANTFATQPTASPEQAEAPTEVRADGQTVRVDRWEIGVRRIVALLWGNRQDFEVDEVVEAVRAFIPEPRDDDDSLVQSILATQPTASNAGERPIEVTRAMLRAGSAEWLKYGAHYAVYPLAQDFERVSDEWAVELSRATHVYRAMAALASKPPAGEQKPDMRAVCEALGFDPTNHHNAAKCPYCRPQPEQVAQDREDAENYRWLCTHMIVPAPSLWDNGVGFVTPALPRKRGAMTKAELDDAIRAARARGEKGGAA